jgi:hypothetical protein
MPADDSIFEKALERQMRKRPVDGIDDATQSEACPDAELLAAYHERSLSDEEMVLWKEHIASCGRCQDVLAALETTEEISLGGEREGEFAAVTDALGGMFSGRSDPAPRATEKITPLVRMSAAPVGVASAPAETASGPYQKRTTQKYWVMAAGTMAAALLYVGVATLRHQAPLQTANTVETAKAVGATKPGVAEEPQLSAQNVPSKALSTQPLQGVAPSVAERDQKMTGQVGKTDSGSATADSLQTRRREDSPKKLKGLTGVAPLPGARSNDSGQGTGFAAGRAAGSPAVAAPPTPPTLQEPKAEDAKKSAASSANETIVVNEAPPVAIGTASGSVAVSSEKPAAAPSQKKDESAQAAMTVEVQSQYHAKAIGGSLGLSKERDSHLIVAPGGNVIWRVGAAGTIEQSTNAGATWAKQTSGVTDKTLRNGSAPSDAVCWVVGSVGTILRTVDGGGHWMAVVSPLGPGAKKGELGGVLGVDALHATVWDARNTKQFSTSDGGQSWVRVEEQKQ